MEEIKIMIAEDHEIYREGLKMALSDIGNIKLIAEAINGQQIVELVINEQPQVVLMDLNMPILNGVEATKKIKALFPEVNIIALTVNDDYESLHKMNEAGARGYLLKTTDKKEIIEAIETVALGKSFYCKDTKLRLKDLFENEIKFKSKSEVSFELSDKEMMVLKLLCDNKSTKEIAGILDASVRTVEGIKGRIAQKFDVPDTVGIVLFAIKNKIVKM